MGRFPSPQVRLRDANCIANTNMTNELVAAILAQQPQFATGQERPARAVPFLFTASIASAGPKGETDYTDSRYFVKPLYLPGSSAPTAKIGGVGLQGPQPDATLLGTGVVTATNLAELSYGIDQTGIDSHLLLTSQIVRCWAWPDVGAPASSQNPDGLPANVHFVFNLPPPAMVPVVLTVDGGSNPNYTYKMSYRGQILNKFQSPQSPRYTTSVVAATVGYAHINHAGGSGQYILGWCNEAPDTTLCTS